MKMNFSFNTNTKEKIDVEDSVSLRAVTTAMALTGVIASGKLTDIPVMVALLSIIGCVIGSYLSYKRRYANNFVVKIWLSVGIIAVAAAFFNELLILVHANVADARVPLTKLLMLLIALHCFDLPRRRDLSVSALVGATLITSAATLSRDLSFSFFIAIFMLLSITMFHLDCVSRSLSKAALKNGTEENTTKEEPIKKQGEFSIDRKALKQVLYLCAFVSTATLLVFSVIPRTQFNLMHEFRLNGSLPYQMQMMSLLSDSMSKLVSPDGSIKPGANAYYGFAEELDTNYRGKLGDELVLSVAGSRGAYLRGMAYDTFDGRVWRMSRPKDTSDLITRPGARCFDVSLHEYSAANVRSKQISQLIYVEADSSNLVVCASVPYQVYFPSTTLKLDTYASIRSPVGILKDQVYTVFSNVPIFNYKDMRESKLVFTPIPGKKRRHASYLQLPDNLKSTVAQLSARVAGTGSDFSRAERLCNYLQANYKYDLDVSPTASDTDTVSDFLHSKKKGYCEHFATALAIMCRTQGIPSRLVTGYLPGNYNPFTGLWEIRLHDAHSWTEVWVLGYGWVPLDATPNSLMVAGELQEPQSVFTYLAEELTKFSKKVLEDPTAQALFSRLHSFILLIYQSSLKFSSQLNTILSIATLIALLASAIFMRDKLKTLMRKITFWRLPKSPKELQRDASLAAASQEFLHLASTLKTLGIERRPQDTSGDLLSRALTSIDREQLQSDKFAQNLSEFMDLYADIRFGGAAFEDTRIKELSISLDKMARDMAEQRKTKTLVKQNC